MPSTFRVSPAVTMRTAWPRSTKRRANSYERVPPTPSRVTKNWWRYRICTRFGPAPGGARCAAMVSGTVASGEPRDGRRGGCAAPRDRLAAARGGRAGDQAREPRPGFLQAAARRPSRRAVRAVEAAHDGPRRAIDGRRHLRDPGRPAHHARRPPPAALLTRRAAEPRERPEGRVGARRPAPDRAGAGGPLHRPPAAPPRGEAGHHGVGADQRPHLAAVAGADRAGRLVRGAPVAEARPAHPAAHRADAGHGPWALQRGPEAGLVATARGARRTLWRRGRCRRPT